MYVLFNKETRQFYRNPSAEILRKCPRPQWNIMHITPSPNAVLSDEDILDCINTIMKFNNERHGHMTDCAEYVR